MTHRSDRRFSIVLVQMPFAPVKQAPLALLQLQAVVRQWLADRVSVRIVYPSHDFANRLGVNLYHQIAYADSDLRPGEMSGLGDWFFREVAFPGLPDNSAEYRRRYFSEPGGFVDVEAVLASRRGAQALLDEVIDRYDLRAADLVGFTSMFAQQAACVAMARLLKQTAAPPLVVVGGANCEGPMGQALADNVPHFDAVFSGPALKSFPTYIRACIGDVAADARHTRGILTARVASRSVPSAGSMLAMAAPAVSHDSMGEELDIEVPLAIDYETFLDAFESAFKGALDPVLTFETSRGCWWGAKAHCPFCGLNGSTMAYRAMRPDRAIALFEHLFQYAPRCKVFECVDNIMPADYPATVIPRVSPPPSTVVYYEVKADLTARDLTAMADAGVRLIQPGIEALSTPSLKALKKGTSACGNVVLLKNCLALGVVPVWNLLIGVPLEENPHAVYEKYAADIPAMRHLPPPWAVFKVRIDRFSPYFMNPSRYGLTLRPKEFYRFVYPFGDQQLFDLAYYFDDANAGVAAYAEAAAQWHPVLNQLVRDWFGAWHIDEIAKRPALYVERRGSVHRLHDSRLAKTIEEAIGPDVVALLAHLDKPTKVQDALERLESSGTRDPESVLAEVRDRRLLFEEGDRLLSLVHLGSRPLCPAPVGGL